MCFCGFGVVWFICLFVSNGDDRALGYNYLLLLLISHLSKQWPVAYSYLGDESHP